MRCPLACLDSYRVCSGLAVDQIALDLVFLSGWPRLTAQYPLCAGTGEGWYQLQMLRNNSMQLVQVRSLPCANSARKRESDYLTWQPASLLTGKEFCLCFDTRETMQSQRNCTSGLRMPRLPNSFLPSVAMRQSLLAHDILMCSFDRVLAQRRGRVASTCGGFRFPNNNHRITTPCGVPARDFSAAGQSVY